ncbi:MAG: hypothetical protein HY791_10010 [Deltaproteobacteria bacterium]|nr:hypothetical protein [Deltaproteobacteria bacterium]
MHANEGQALTAGFVHSLRETPMHFGFFPIAPPAGEDLAILLWRRIERDYLLPALDSRSGAEFVSRAGECLPNFVGPRVALGQVLLSPLKSRQSVESVEALLAAVEAFGGERWVDAVSDAINIVRRATRCFEAVQPNLTASHSERIARFGGRLLLHSFAMSCLAALLADPRAANAEVREAVRTTLRSAASDAHTAIRSIEIELQAQPEDEVTTDEPLAGEARALEQEAEEASRELLARVERA